MLVLLSSSMAIFGYCALAFTCFSVLAVRLFRSSGLIARVWAEKRLPVAAPPFLSSSALDTPSWSQRVRDDWTASLLTRLRSLMPRWTRLLPYQRIELLPVSGDHLAPQSKTQKQKQKPLVDLEDVVSPSFGIFPESSNVLACPTPETHNHHLPSPVPRYAMSPPPLMGTTPFSTGSPAPPPVLDPFSPFSSPKRSRKGKERDMDVEGGEAQPLVQFSPGVIYPHMRPRTPSPVYKNAHFLSTSPTTFVPHRRTKSMGGVAVKKVLGVREHATVPTRLFEGKFVPGSFGAPAEVFDGDTGKAKAELLIDFGIEDRDAGGGLVEVGVLRTSEAAAGSEEERLVDVSPYRPTVELLPDLWVMDPEPLWSEVEERENGGGLVDAGLPPWDGKELLVPTRAEKTEEVPVEESVEQAMDVSRSAEEDNLEPSTSIEAPVPILDCLRHGGAEPVPVDQDTDSPVSAISIALPAPIDNPTTHETLEDLTFPDPDDLPLPKTEFVSCSGLEPGFADPDLPELPALDIDFALAIASALRSQSLALAESEALLPAVVSPGERKAGVVSQIPTPPDSPPVMRASLGVDRRVEKGLIVDRSVRLEEHDDQLEDIIQPGRESVDGEQIVSFPLIFEVDDEQAVSEVQSMEQEEREEELVTPSHLSETEDEQSEAESVEDGDAHVGKPDSGAVPAWSLRATEAPRFGVIVTPSSQLTSPIERVSKSPEIREAKGYSNERPINCDEDEDDSVPGFFPQEERKLAEPSSSTQLQIAKPNRARALSVSFGASIASSMKTRPSPLDIALAMQMRPGLGAGADPAWMVRFLMAAFGWFVVVVSGSVDEL